MFLKINDNVSIEKQFVFLNKQGYKMKNVQPDFANVRCAVMWKKMCVVRS